MQWLVVTCLTCGYGVEGRVGWGVGRRVWGGGGEPLIICLVTFHFREEVNYMCICFLSGGVVEAQPKAH